MVKEHGVLDNVTISVKLKSGAYFDNMDITERPQGENELYVSFYISDEIIRAYPMDQVEFFEYNLNKEKTDEPA